MNRFPYTVVIPAYNEARTIYDVVTRALHHTHSVTVIDDGSSDGTVEALDQLPVTIFRHPRNVGKAAALLCGVRHALECGATAVITLDGDGQHRPEDIPALIAMHRRAPCSIIIGSRLHEAQLIPTSRYIANRLADFWISWAAGQRIIDTQSGFRLYPAAVLRSLIPSYDWTTGFVFESELLIEAGRKGMRICSIPVSPVYGRHLRRSHFKKVRDIVRITRMVGKKLIARRLDLPALRKSRRWIIDAADGSSPRESFWATEPRRRRILMFAEAVSLAHVARSITLARSLDPSRYEVHLACDPRYLSLFNQLDFPLHAIRSIDTELFQRRLAEGDPLYSTADYRSYVQEDLRVMTDWEPDLVIGDFRLSLSVSARLLGIRYATVTNAHWSPYAQPRFIVPELPITRKCGAPIAQVLFNLLRPLVFAQQARPLNKVRRDFDLPAVGHTLSHLFSNADYTWYADLPQLVPTTDLPSHHRYIGPVVWSFPRQPWWWPLVRNDRRTAYVTMGTSGKAELTDMIANTLTEMGWQVLMATAAREAPTVIPGVWSAPYLPGTVAARKADLVICNGGSATVYQALAAGTPILGMPTNLDQYLMMGYIRSVGAGDYIRAGEASPESIERSVSGIMRSIRCKAMAIQLQEHIADSQTGKQFESCVDRVLGGVTEPCAPPVSAASRPETSSVTSRIRTATTAE